jgi:hypothetical protein
MSVSTTTTTNADGTVTKVVHEAESWLDEEGARFHDRFQSWAAHLESIARSSGWFSIAYAAFTFARHLNLL